jgi:hypothetical protein
VGAVGAGVGDVGVGAGVTGGGFGFGFDVSGLGGVGGASGVETLGGLTGPALRSTMTRTLRRPAVLAVASCATGPAPRIGGAGGPGTASGVGAGRRTT